MWHRLPPVPRDLEAILEQVEKVQAVVKSKRTRHKIKSFFKGASHESTLQKCSDDLDWAIKQFDVSYDALHSTWLPIHASD